MNQFQMLGRRLLTTVFGGILMLGCLLPLTAHADDSMDELTLAEAEVLSTSDMGQLRAGFVDPSGYLVSFAVDVRTTIDGSLMFVRSLVLSMVNGQFQTTDSSQLVSGGIPTGATANLIDDGKGVSITDENGNTTLLNQTAQGTFANVILNAASNRDIAQNMNINIVLGNMQTIAGGAIAGVAQHVAGFTALAQTARAHASGLKF